MFLKFELFAIFGSPKNISAIGIEVPRWSVTLGIEGPYFLSNVRLTLSCLHNFAHDYRSVGKGVLHSSLRDIARALCRLGKNFAPECPMPISNVILKKQVHHYLRKVNWYFWNNPQLVLINPFTHETLSNVCCSLKTQWWCAATTWGLRSIIIQ